MTVNIAKLSQNSTAVPAGLSDCTVRIRGALEKVDAARVAASSAGYGFLLAVKVAGEELLAANEKLEHGAWGPWIEANFACSVRQANNYIAIAKGWARIEEHFGNAISDLSLNAALRLLRPKKPARPKAPIADPFSDEVLDELLSQLSPEERAQLRTRLVRTDADVPAAIAAGIAQSAFMRGRAAAVQAAKQDQAVLATFVAGVRTTLKTNAAPERKIEDIQERLRHFDTTTGPDWTERMAPQSLYPKPALDPDQGALLDLIGRGKNAASPDAPPTPTKH